MADALTRSMRASHLLVAGLTVAALGFAAVAAAMHDTFYLRLATEALIFAGMALSVDILLGIPACCRSDRHCISASVPICRRWC